MVLFLYARSVRHVWHMQTTAHILNVAQDKHGLLESFINDAPLVQPCVRATGYCRAMAQCALQKHSARYDGRGLGFVTPCPNKQGKNAYFSKVSDASGTASDVPNVRKDCQHFGPPLWVVLVEERGPFGGPS